MAEAGRPWTGGVTLSAGMKTKVVAFLRLLAAFSGGLAIRYMSDSIAAQEERKATETGTQE